MLIPPLNESLQQMLKGRTATMEQSIFTVQTTDSSIYCSFGASENNGLLIATIPFQILITWDIMLYVTIQGTEILTANWCWTGQLQHKHWQDKNHQLGNEWTLQSLRAKAQKVY
jgi:hypothetical protein